MDYRPDHAEHYDLVFRSRGKDFEAEADQLTDLIRRRMPGAASLLDVACGTGAHLERLRAEFGDLAGVEISPGMRAVASRRLTGIPVHDDDMRTVDLGRTFDAVVCIGNAVACMTTRADLDLAVERLAAHVVTGGVLVVEPWWFPDNFIDGYVGGHLVRDGDRVLSRITRSVRDGGHTRMEITFVIVEPSGVRQFTDVLVTSLFTREEYETALERAGCSVEFVEPMALEDGRPNGPGLFVGIRK